MENWSWTGIVVEFILFDKSRHEFLMLKKKDTHEKEAVQIWQFKSVNKKKGKKGNPAGCVEESREGSIKKYMMRTYFHYDVWSHKLLTYESWTASNKLNYVA